MYKMETLPQDMILCISHYLTNSELLVYKLTAKCFNITSAKKEVLYRKYHDKDLHDLVKTGNLDGVQYFDIDDNIEITELMVLASNWIQPTIMQYFIAKGADVHVRDDEALIDSCIMGRLNSVICKIM